MFDKFGVDNVLYIFVALLNERRVIVTSKQLGVLTGVLNAISVLVYPFAWQVCIRYVLDCIEG